MTETTSPGARQGMWPVRRNEEFSSCDTLLRQSALLQYGNILCPEFGKRSCANSIIEMTKAVIKTQLPGRTKEQRGSLEDVRTVPGRLRRSIRFR